MRKHATHDLLQENGTTSSPQRAAAADKPLCQLTSRDYTLLQAHLARFEERTDGISAALKPLMRAKLREARVVLPEDIAEAVATGNSRVVFVADGRRETRILTHWESQAVPGLHLPIATLLGLTLLGMREGQHAPLRKADGGSGRVLLEKVVYQPEDAARQQACRPD